VDSFLAVTQGVGLSLASGWRSFLPPLLAGALARADAGVDFTGTDYSFIESTWFLALVLALNALVFALGLAERRGMSVHPPAPVLAAPQVAFGAILFAGSLAENGEVAWPGLVAGAVLALLAVLVSGGVFSGASRRQGEAAASLEVYFDLAAIALAAAAIFISPVALVALAGILWLALSRRRRSGRKHEGLRILR
jgi:hypothetical protein